ncbi:amino acid adenylation domain-containing protein [Lentzea sp. NPDC051213]|uniref:amino acid adenylation domain-containing protein n=1 Tax=Lentzea sp. NPDC051213 TaxID=3364126 RepID=UPI0037884ECB
MNPTLPDLFAEQARTTPDAVAVLDDRHEITYAALDRRSGLLAAALRANGHGVGSIVGVRMRRGADLVVALLGIWKAGAAYVPLDPEHPEERFAAILADTGCELVLTAQSLQSFVDESGEVAASAATAGDAAYVIYTSGSTGKPKGVVITHAGIANRVGWTVGTHGLSAADRILQKTNLSFDAAAWEVFAPLVSGGTVVLAPVGAERDPAMMLAAVVRHRVTVLQVVPSVLRLLVAEPALRDCTSLRLLFSAGEALHAELLQQLWAQLPVETWNTYGPTECAIDVTAHRCDPAQTSGPVPIGKPITGAHVLVLDDNGEFAPIGVPGELHLGGAGVAMGYLGRPAMTAEKFVPDPIGPPGSRLYRTGDRARWRSDGVLEYLGRLDDQLKINGVRIEPAEIEIAVQAHPGVHACVVLGVPDNQGSKRLVAYVVADDEVGTAELRAFLRKRLPEYLVPTVFMLVATLPLTVSGKVDRTALRALDITENVRGLAYVRPATVPERMVADIWSELLAADRIGLDDDFFQLGGHSLLITQLAERLRAISGRRVEMATLFASTTVRAQARLLSEQDSAAPPPVARPRGPRVPLSFGQQRLWFLEKLRQGDPEYTVPLFLDVAAETDEATVRKALDALASRHEVLRTRYVLEDGEPYQVIDPPTPVDLRTVEGDPVALFRAELALGFDLEHGPVWRALLVRGPGGAGTLLVTAHHIACDGRSVVVLAEEFGRLCAGEELPAPSIQYADHAIWQRQALTDDVFATQSEYWKTALDGLRPLELPVDRPRAAERDSRGAALEFTVPPATAKALVEQGRQQGATPFMALLTVFHVLLARYSRGWDVAVGTPIEGRTRPEVGEVVGFFLNSLVLRAAVRPEQTFTEALAAVRATCLAAFAHSDIPFERLVEQARVDRDLSRTPLYQVIFDLHDEALSSTNSDSVDTETMRAIWTTAKTDLTLIMRKHGDGSLQGVFEYATALFDEATVERMAANFVRLAETLTAAPDSPVSAVEITTPAEHDLLVREWNDTAGPVADLPVHRLFEAQAARRPDAVALVTTHPTTYAELDERANRFATVLRARGAGPESVVGVLLDRSVDLVACLLGVWKAGAAFVPLDPSFPADRVALVLADSRAEVLLTDTRLAVLAGGFTGATVLVDGDHAEIATASGTAPPVPDDLDRLAYVIYTSGSTGRPKGVAVTHLGLANYLLWTVDAYAAHGTGGAPVFSSIAYDLGMPNLYTPLITGQPVHLLPQDVDLTKLGAMLADAGPFSFMKMAPAQLELVSHQLAARAPSPLAGLVIAAGDRVPAAMADRWREVTGQPDARFAGEYGPTEITVGNSVFHAGEPWSGEFLSIGRPIPNTTMYVLDEHLNPAPIGALGEIYVGGVGVARGYVGNSALTAEKFVPDPYGPPGARLYRTGDLGRVTGTGAVEFRGRADDQVKIRGYRVELGEVEAAVLAHPDVREAVVVLREDRLVAYYVGDGVSGLRESLVESMPRHQVPDVFVPLESLPLTANGKVDHRALPTAGTRADGGGEAPRTVLERAITDIWSEVLHAEVGVHDNFFELGGHSISATRVVSTIQERFGVEIGIRVLFDQPTIAGLASAVENEIRADVDRLSAADVMAETMRTEGWQT